MKKLLSAVVIGSLFVAGSVSAKVNVIEENFDDIDITFARVHHLNTALDVFTFDDTFNPVAGDLTQELTTYVRGRNLYVAEGPSIKDVGGVHGSVMSMGSSTVDEVSGWTGWYGHQNLAYTFNTLGTDASVSFKYLNDRDGRGAVTVMFQEVDSYGNQLWIKSITFEGTEEVEGWQDLYLSPDEIVLATGGHSFNRIEICEWDIGTDGDSYIDDVVITYETPDPVSDDLGTVRYVTVEKEGWYTAEFVQGLGVAAIYANDELKGEFLSGKVDIGYLYTGDTIALTVDGSGADTIETIDWQSWNFNFDENGVQIYVEDPPMCSDDDLTTAFDEGVASVDTTCDTEVVTEYIEVEKVVTEYIEVEKVVVKEVPVVEYIEVPVVVDNICNDLTALDGRMLKKAEKYCKRVEFFIQKVASMVGSGYDYRNRNRDHGNHYGNSRDDNNCNDNKNKHNTHK